MATLIIIMSAYLSKVALLPEILPEKAFFPQPNMQLDHPNLAHIAPILAPDKIYQ